MTCNLHSHFATGVVTATVCEVNSQTFGAAVKHGVSGRRADGHTFLRRSEMKSVQDCEAMSGSLPSQRHSKHPASLASTSETREYLPQEQEWALSALNYFHMISCHADHATAAEYRSYHFQSWSQRVHVEPSRLTMLPGPCSI